MLELLVTALRSGKVPAIFTEESEHISNFHASNIICRVTPPNYHSAVSALLLSVESGRTKVAWTA
jgi:hypothetical protein